MIPVYLAGSSRELPRARAARAALLELGLVVAGGDWIEEVDTHGSVGLRLPQDVRETIAAAWVASIRGAGVVCALVPDDHVSVGLVHELGVARALGRPVVLASKTPRARMHPALLSPGWTVYGADDAALRAAYQMTRRA